MTARRRRPSDRVVGTVLAGVIALVVITPFALRGAGRSADTIRRDNQQIAAERLAHGFLSQRTDEVPPPPNVWIVNVADDWFVPLGDTWTEPPLLNLAGVAFEDPPVREYDFDGKWIASGEPIAGDEVLLTVIARDDQDAAIAATQRNWLLATVGAALVAAGAAWVILGRATAPVERAHAVNRDFIADAAHELRTPLAIVQASASHALARERSPEAYRESLEEILLATERAGASVGELLEFARLEAGQATLRFAPLRLDLLVEEVASSIRIDGVTVEAVPGEAVVVEADFHLVRQVIDNIARNAAARADKVQLSTRLTTTMARIEIADDGPGFDPGVIDHVFERFRRGDESGSVGLGMAIARTVVEMHGGTCEATNRPSESGEPGGAIVIVELPFKQ